MQLNIIESSCKWNKREHILNSVQWEIWFVMKSGQISQTVKHGKLWEKSGINWPNQKFWKFYGYNIYESIFREN